MGAADVASLDVAVLYDIVAAAHESPHVDDLPFRTLFNAYDETLARHGIEADHDQLYLRFLFRLGERRDPGQTLYEAFEALLEEQGIVLELGSEGPDEEVRAAIAQESDGKAEDAANGEPFAHGRRRERRASFSSFIDAEEENTRGSRRRAGSAASLSRLQDHSEGFGSKPFKLVEPLQESKGKAPASEIHPTEARAQARQSISSRPSRHAHQHDPHQQLQDIFHAARYDKKPKKVFDENEHPRTNRKTNPPTIPIHEDSTLQKAQFDAAEPSGRALELPFRQELFYRPSDAQLERDADTFYHFHIRSLSRLIIGHWQARALHARDSHTRLHVRAVRHDAAILLRQGFEQWRDVYALKKRVAETERLFELLDAKAVRARNLFLLTKAFTHWAQCAADEVERTNAARRRILKLRYFNAWQEFTAVNSLKVRRFMLQRFFETWKERLNWLTRGPQHAVVLYQGNLAQKIFRLWYWAVCERQVERWRSARLKRSFAIRWAQALQKTFDRTRRVHALRDAEIQRRALSTWSQQTEVARYQQRQAEDFYQGQLVARCLPQWELQLRLAPAARQVQRMVQWRIASSTFSAMERRLYLEQQAELVNRHHIVRSAWTAWNDRLRWQTLLHQIDDRLATQALYKWVIKERFMLMKRLHEERLRVSVFDAMFERWETAKARHDEAFRAVEHSRNRRLMQATLVKLLGASRLQCRRDAMALEFYEPRVRQDAMQAWHAKYEQGIQLGRWCVEAVYYFRATRTLKAMQAAVVQSRKQKRRDGYAQIRRKVKMNLARNVLGHWHEEATQALSLEQIAAPRIANRQRALANSVVSQWRSSLLHAQEIISQAIKRDEAKLIALSFRQWFQRLDGIDQDARAAHDFARSRTEKAAFDFLRRLQLSTLEHRALAAKANTVFSWSDRRRLRMLLRGWADRTREKHGAELSPSRSGEDARATSSSAERRHSSARTPLPRRTPPYADPISHVLSVSPPAGALFSPPPSEPSLHAARSPPFEQTPAFPLPGLAAPTPLPGYLSTPFKRAERARALVSLDAESSRGPRADSANESFTPATSGLRDLRRSVLGRSIPAFPRLRSTREERVRESLEENDEKENTEARNGREGIRGTGAHGDLETSRISARDGVRRSLFSSHDGRQSRR